MKWVLTALAAAAMLAGCSQQISGSSQVLGQVSYDEAFTAGKQVMSSLFPVATADRYSGVITSRPKALDLRSERLVSRLARMRGSSARRIATLKLRQSTRGVIAFASVEIQRQDSPVHRHLVADAENYDSVPNKTPAELEAASTFEQNELWRTERRDRAMEQRILSAVYAKLNPPGK
jgi:hypothetical protein